MRRARSRDNLTGFPLMLAALAGPLGPSLPLTLAALTGPLGPSLPLTLAALAGPLGPGGSDNEIHHAAGNQDRLARLPAVEVGQHVGLS